MKAPVLALAFILCGFAATYTSAATLVVTKTEDTNDGICDADCSLREAVAVANADDTVVFSPLFNAPQTITLMLGQIAITKNLTINGKGPDISEVSGNNAGRIFRISGGVIVSISGLKLANGLASVAGDAVGGAIYQTAGSLTLTNMTISNNVARQSNSPSFGNGGGILVDSGTVTAMDSSISNNTAATGIGGGGGIFAIYSTVNLTRCIVSSNDGEGIYGTGNSSTQTTINVTNSNFTANRQWALWDQGGSVTAIDSTFRNNGGGVGTPTTLTIENSVISNNSNAGVVNTGTASITNTTIHDNYYRFSTGGGGINNGGTMYVLNSAITGNRAVESGGGVYNVVGRLYLTNSTVSGNLANNSGGGVYNTTGINGTGSVILTNSTITNNTANGIGGGVSNNGGGIITAVNSIIARNIGISNPDFSGAVMSNGYNLIGNITGSTGWLATDLLNLDPLLGLLGNNGGQTLTHAVLPGSPAINAGNNNLARNPQNNLELLTDQRGVGFLRTVDNLVDIGAYEAHYATGPVTVSGQILVALGGRGISKAYITLTDVFGNVRYTQTNPFGYYRFTALVPGITYTIRVSHKSYLFDSPQYFTADQNRADLNFFSAIGDAP
jgi:CSLREA domain-containing protein